MHNEFLNAFDNDWLNIIVMGTSGRADVRVTFEPYELKNRDRFWQHALDTLEALGSRGKAALMLAVVGRKNKRVFEVALTTACRVSAQREETTIVL